MIRKSEYLPGHVGLQRRGASLYPSYLRITAGYPGSIVRSGFFLPAAGRNLVSHLMADREKRMHLYWRVQLDLNEMGSVLILHNPNLIRAFRLWIKKNAGGLAIAQNLTAGDFLSMKANLN